MGDDLKRRIFSPIRTSKISDEVYKQLVAMISSGRLKPGEKLPPEREMASNFGISRQSLREALYRAEIVGLIGVRQGEGSFVLSSVSESLKPPLVVLMEEQAERIFEFLEIRKLIEGWCAGKAAREARAEDLRKMQEILAKMTEVTTEDKRWEQMDVNFHFSIVEATHNVIAMHIMEAIKDSFATFFRFREAITRPQKKDLLWQHHHEIFAAISRRDPSLARRKVVAHLNFIEKKIREDIQTIRI